MSSDTPTAGDPLHTIAHAQACLVKGTATLRELAKMMQDNACSALLVTKHDGSHAVVTERDIVRALARDLEPDDDWAVDVMSLDIRKLPPDAPILEAAVLMQEAVIRHVVIDHGDDDLRLVSIRDLLAPFIATVED